MRSKLGITACLVFAGCDGATDPAVTHPTAAVRWIVVEPPSLNLVAGSVGQLTASAQDVRNAVLPDIAIAWSTTNASVAIVSDSGEVTAVGKGTAVITASGGGRSRTAAVSVRMPADALTLSTSPFGLLVGDSRTVLLFAADTGDNPIPDVSPTWVSSAPNVASVATVGMTAVVTARSLGAATITASADGKDVAVNVTVDAPPAVAGLWDFVEQLADTTDGTAFCGATGSVAVTQSGPVVNGLWDQIGSCGNEEFGWSDNKSGALLSGRAGVNALTFSVGEDSTACLYDVAVNAERTAIAGAVRCGRFRGTWQATRGLPIVAMNFVGSAGIVQVLRGESRTFSVELVNAAGDRAFRRAVSWSTSNDQVATITRDASSQSARFDAAGGGTATISASFESAAASLTVTVSALTLEDVVAGARMTCGHGPGGVLYCWGDMPRPTFTSPRFESLSIGAGQGCGLDTDGIAYCWVEGEDYSDGYVSPVATNLRFAKISAGGWIDSYYYYYDGTRHPHACATTTDGTAYCWGDDSRGQLGDGRYGSPVATPLAVSTDLRFSAIAAGGLHTCGISVAGRAYCWGDNSDGQLGNGTNVRKLVPTEVAGSVDFASIYAGTIHTCALTAAGAAWCWGANYFGAVGAPGQASRTVPVEVSGTLTFRALAVGAEHSCGLTTGGDVYCWGSNYSGQLGLPYGGITTAHTPQRILGNLKFTTISSGPGAYHSCGYATDQRVYCWGSPSQLGAGPAIVAGPRAVLGQR